MDMGSLEQRSRRSARLFGDIATLMMQKGVYVESRIVPYGEHNEASWEKQIPFFMDMLFYGLDEEH